MRIAALLPCLLLTACFTSGGEPELPSAATPQASGTRGSAARAEADPSPADKRDTLTQARADCWMKVEHEKVRDLDRRIAFVDKCVAQATKGKP